MCPGQGRTPASQLLRRTEVSDGSPGFLICRGRGRRSDTTALPSDSFRKRTDGIAGRPCGPLLAAGPRSTGKATRRPPSPRGGPQTAEGGKELADCVRILAGEPPPGHDFRAPFPLQSDTNQDNMFYGGRRQRASWLDSFRGKRLFALSQTSGLPRVKDPARLHSHMARLSSHFTLTRSASKGQKTVSPLFACGSGWCAGWQALQDYWNEP